MDVSRRSGRIAALAAALGLGAAILTGHGVSGPAWAEPDDSSPSSADSPGGERRSASPAASSDTATASGPKRTDTAVDRQVSSAPQGGATSSGSNTDDANRAASEEAEGDNSERASEVAPPVDRVTESEVGPPSPSTRERADSTASKTDRNSPIHTLGAAPNSLADEHFTTRDVVDRVSAVSPSTSSGPESADVPVAASAPSADGPAAPTVAPTLWTLLAFARREVGESAQVRPTGHAPVAESPTADALYDVNTGVDAVSPTESSYDDAFIGQPSLISSITTFGLQVTVRVLRFLGLQDLVAAASTLLEARKPPALFTLGLNVERSQYNGWEVWKLKGWGSTSDKAVVAVHGGGYTVDMNVLSWLGYANWARDTGATVIVPLYPVIRQGGTAETVVPQMADFISEQITENGAGNVSVEGDSAGASIAMAAVQELVRRGSPTPARMVFISPALDYTLTDPRSASIDDPLIDIDGLREAGEQWAGSLPGGAANPLVSPLFGSLDGLPPTWIYSSSLDVLSPAVLDLRDKAHGAGAPFTFILRRGQLHTWPGFFWLPEAIADSQQVGRLLVGVDQTGVSSRPGPTA